MKARYFRCQTETCRRKWHHTSLVARAPAPRSSLFDVPVVVAAGCCPACGGDLEPETGSFEELFQPANSDDIFDHGRPML